MTKVYSIYKDDEFKYYVLTLQQAEFELRVMDGLEVREEFRWV